MSAFNENPFLKDTPVVPFSNGTDAMAYSESNCQRCVNYSDSEDEDLATCKLAFHLDMGSFLGEIPLWVAKELGCKYDPLYGFVILNSKCRKFSDGNDDMPF